MNDDDENIVMVMMIKQLLHEKSTYYCEKTIIVIVMMSKHNYCDGCDGYVILFANKDVVVSVLLTSKLLVFQQLASSNIEPEMSFAPLRSYQERCRQYEHSCPLYDGICNVVDSFRRKLHSTFFGVGNILRRDQVEQFLNNEIFKFNESMKTR